MFWIVSQFVCSGEEEQFQFDRYLQEQHYLESSVLVGQSLRYVAELDGQ